MHQARRDSSDMAATAQYMSRLAFGVAVADVAVAVVLVAVTPAG